MEEFMIRGWELILPECGGTSALARGATLATRCLHEPQPVSNRPVRLACPHPAGRYRPGGSAFSSPGCWSCRGMEEILTRGWGIILPWCGGTSTLSQKAILAARWLHEPQPIGNQPDGLEFSHLAGRYRPETYAFSSPGYWSCRYIEGFLTRRWELILPGCGGTSALARGATLAARLLHEPQSTSNHPVGLGFPHLGGRYGPG